MSMPLDPQAAATATALSHHLAALAAGVGPSLVRVESGHRSAATGAVWAPGVVVTAQHALDLDLDLSCGLADGRTVPATLAGRDPGTDVAVLRVPDADLPPAAFADLAEAQVGHLVLAAARPGRTVRVALGVLSALGESWRTRGGGRVEHYVETDLALPPGFAGGLLVAASGAALGLLTPALVRGASIAVPAPTLGRVVATLLDRGRIERGFLGVGSYPAELGPVLARELGQATALIAVSVEPESPAANAGMLLGDVLVAMDGRPLRQVRDLIELLDGERIGTEAALRIVRAGEPRELKVRIGARGPRGG
jgi:serine protease DegQ